MAKAGSLEMNLYTLVSPQQWKAGELSGKPFYFDCGECEANEPVIFGYIGTGPQYKDIAVRTGKDGWGHLLLLCQDCFIQRGGNTKEEIK